MQAGECSLPDNNKAIGFQQGMDNRRVEIGDDVPNI
jgi:hypothetical protein